MYTNLKNFGGYFKTLLDKEFAVAKNVTIASGYASLDIIHAFNDSFIKIADSGGNSRLLLGMAFYEGLSQKKLDALSNLNFALSKYNNQSGVYVTNGRRYHGKIYHFYDDDISNFYVGSSNFSFSGTKGNIECTIPVKNDSQKTELKLFLDDLYSSDNSVTIDRAEIIVPGKKIIIQTGIKSSWDALKRYDPKTVDKTKYLNFEYPLRRVAEKEKSNLNVYFGKGRLNTTNGKILPRPWYELELIADKEVNTNPVYPKGDFLAYTDDGFIIPMRTQGDYYKNIRSKASLQIFGIWLKGKLERAGALQKYEPVTLDTLEEYGNDKLIFYKMEEGKFYVEF